LAIAAAALGAALASIGVGLVRALGAAYFPRTQEIALDGPVFWFLAALTAMSALLFGLVPAVHGGGGPVDEALRSTGRSATGGAGAVRLRRARRQPIRHARLLSPQGCSRRPWLN
jgi:hypothetical protein